jgi:hypothetical protein
LTQITPVKFPRKSATAQPKPSANQRRRGSESGYAYLMALFLVLSLMISSQVILRNLVTERVSQREEEVIWRGQQYARAIKVYYHKTGHYPQKQDDLITGVPGMHFLRDEVSKDPMNKDEDGAWRFIYTNAAGAIIGSVKYGSLQQMAMMDLNGGQLPAPAQPGQQGTDASHTQGAGAAANGSVMGATNGLGQSSTGTSFGLGLGGFGNGASGGATGTGAPGATLGPGQVIGALGQPATALGAAQPTGPVDGPVIGGMLVGVGSKVDRKSVRVWKGGTKYNQWEFIWNPLEEQATALQQGIGAATSGAGLGLNGLPLGRTGAIAGTQNGSSTANGATNGTTTTNPNPNQDPNQNPQNNPGALNPAPANP